MAFPLDAVTLLREKIMNDMLIGALAVSQGMTHRITTICAEICMKEILNMHIKMEHALTEEKAQYCSPDVFVENVRQRIDLQQQLRRIGVQAGDATGSNVHDHDISNEIATMATEELLPEEECWKKWSLDELKAEASRHGVFGGAEREQCLATLLEVKRWESLPLTDLEIEGSKREITIDCCLDRDDLLAQMKQDFSWDNMEEEDLRVECTRQNIPLCDLQKKSALDRVMRSRLRQVHRWATMPVEQLRRACQLRNFEADGKSQEEMFQFLKSFKISTKAKQFARPSPPAYQHQSHDQQPEQDNVFGASKNSKVRASWRSSSPDPLDQRQLPTDLSDRVQKICKKYPRFDGSYTWEMNHWSDQDIEMYLYSNGYLKPGENKVEKHQGAPMKLYYHALGLPDGTPASEVKRAYRRLAFLYHPDKEFSNPEAAFETWKNITEAYEVISNCLLEESSMS